MPRVAADEVCAMFDITSDFSSSLVVFPAWALTGTISARRHTMENIIWRFMIASFLNGITLHLFRRNALWLPKRVRLG